MNYPRLRIQRAPTSMETTPIKIDGRISRRRHGGSAEETTTEQPRAFSSPHASTNETSTTPPTGRAGEHHSGPRSRGEHTKQIPAANSQCPQATPHNTTASAKGGTPQQAHVQERTPRGETPSDAPRGERARAKREGGRRGQGRSLEEDEDDETSESDESERSEIREAPSRRNVGSEKQVAQKSY